MTTHSIPFLRKPLAEVLAFVGLHSHLWPNGGDPAPGFRFGWMRTHDMGGPNNAGVSWFDVEKTPGVYDWSVLDPLFAQAAAKGFRVMFTLNSVPRFYSSQPDKEDAYGNFGTGAPLKPEFLGKVVDFILAMSVRYGALLRRVDVSNEPDFSGNGYWWGTAIELVRYCATLKAGLVGTGIEVVSAGFTAVGLLLQFVNAFDPVTGKHGGEAVDSLAVHPYRACPRASYGTNNLQTGDLGFNTLKSALAGTTGAHLDIHVSEWGIDYQAPPTTILTAFGAQSEAYRADYVWNVLDQARRAGFKSFFIYAYGDQLSGDLKGDTFGVIAGINRFIAAST